MTTYRFKYEIVNEETDETLIEGDTFVSEMTSLNGENEGVDMEVGRAMRIFRKVKKELDNEKDKTD